MVAELRKVDRRSGPQLRAIEGSVRLSEEREGWNRAYRLGNRIHLATVAERPDVALASAGELVSLAERRLRQIGGSNDAA